jgi:ubiquinone/menaquinone biosynthesis C-methylase UbiE
LRREIRQSFDEAASNEEHFPSSIDPRIRHVQVLLRFFSPMAGSRLLDAGCGKGRYARVILEQNPSARLIGLDISENMLRRVPPDIARISGTLTDLPFADDSFDGVYATESLEHAVDIGRAIDEMCRVLRPGGKLAIIDKNAEHWGRMKTPAWERWFNRGELEGLIARHCRSVRSEPISYWDDVAPDGLFLSWFAEK